MIRYRADQGEFPADLAVLAPKYIAAVPVDPFSGKPIRLARKDDGRVVVYSVGPDLIDDAGAPLARETQKGDIAMTVGR
jgi:hypothetical protein